MIKISRRFKRIMIGSGVFLFIVAVCVAGWYFTQSEVKDNDLDFVEGESSSGLYVASREIKSGDIISLNDIVEEETGEIDNTFCFGLDDVGSTSLLNIMKGSPILKSMVTRENLDKSLHVVNYDCFSFGNELNKGDYVDVRIRFLDGEDYIVASKCKVDESSGTKVALIVSEEERLMISSAIVDTSVYSATLYLSQYTEPYTQEASVVNYQPFVDVIDLIVSNENIDSIDNIELDTSKRTNLEKRLYAYQKAYENMNNEEITIDNREIDTASNSSENIIYYYDYTGRGVDSVLNSIESVATGKTETNVVEDVGLGDDVVENENMNE